MNKFKNIDVRQSLNILGTSNIRQLKEVEKVLKFELDKCDDLEGKRIIQKTIDILSFVGVLVDE